MSRSSFTAPPQTASNGMLVYFTGAGSGGLLYALANRRPASFTGIRTLTGAARRLLSAAAASACYVGVPCHDYALNPNNGEVLWSYIQGCSGGGGALGSYYDGRVYMDDTFEHFVFDAETGNIDHAYIETAYPAAFWTPASGSPVGYLIDGPGALTSVRSRNHADGLDGLRDSVLHRAYRGQRHGRDRRFERRALRLRCVHGHEAMVGECRHRDRRLLYDPAWAGRVQQHAPLVPSGTASSPPG